MKLTKSQMRLLWVGTGFIILMCLIPPWEGHSGIRVGGRRGSAAVYTQTWDQIYCPIFLSPSPKARIAFLRLTVQCFVVGLLTAAGIFTLQQRDKRREADSQGR